MDKAGLYRAERLSSAVLVAFGLFVAYYSHHYLKLGRMITPGAGFLPYCIGIALAVLGAAWHARTLFTHPVPSTPVGGGGGADAAEGAGPARSLVFSRLLPGVLLVVLYAWLFDKAGYILSTVLFMVGWQKLVEREGWVKTAIVSAASAAFMYVLFARLLRVFLPFGIWWD